MDLKQHIRHVPDFPKAGILFYDITTLLRDPEGFRATVEHARRRRTGHRASTPSSGSRAADSFSGPRWRSELGAGFIPVRKPGKLPAKAIKESYNLEYGKDALEMHVDAIEKGQRILVVDDVLATGGTAAAAAQLVRKLGGDLVGHGVPDRTAVPRRQVEAAGRTGLFRPPVLISRGAPDGLTRSR